jgi:hypothetical protein
MNLAAASDAATYFRDHGTSLPVSLTREGSARETIRSLSPGPALLLTVLTGSSSD